jgi:signal transduction histidine kinase/ligand-binding sensor domain-containing protein
VARVALAVAVAWLPSMAGSARAQSTDGPLSDYTVTTWNENDGLPAGRISGLAQDAEGYLWLATDAGLVRFDGVRFDAWGTLGEKRLPVGAVTALISARDRSLWVGVNGRSPIARIKDGNLTYYDERDGFVGNYTLSFFEDHDGAIWAGSFQGLFRFDGHRWQRMNEAQGLADGSVLAIYEDRDRRMWVATSTAIFRKDPASEHFEQVDVIAISSNVWQSFSEDANGTVWMSDFKEGFRVPTRSARPSPTQRGWGVELLHDRRGNFWVGTLGRGLWRIRDAAAGGRPRLEEITVEQGLASNAVQSLLEDKEGNIWLGTLSGLQRLAPHRVQPLKDLPIPRAIELTPDGSVWVGTAAGLVRFWPSGARRNYTEADGLPGQVVLALYADAKGDLWVSTERGVARFSHERFSGLLLAPGERVQRILGLTGSGDTLWLRDFYLRLFRYRNGELTLAADVPDSHRRAASSVYAGPSGNLWVGSTNGSLGLRSRTGAFEAHELGIGNVVAMFEDARGGFWVGGDDGLSYYENGQFTTITRRNGFPGGVKSIADDELGFVWIGTEVGILRMDRGEVSQVAADPAHEVRYRRFNTSDGVAGVPFAEGSPSGVRARDGRLWFIASSGITIIDPRHLGEVAPPPAVRIESVTADARVMPLGSALDLPARTSHLQIGFTTTALSDPMRMRFRYRLEGFDREWVDAGSSRQASYTNLPPRQYHFQVMASAGDGRWGEPGAALEFSIQPMFYQTLWFYVACGLTVFLMVYAAWQIHVRQVRRQFALVLAERIRMSRAIHDTLLQGLAALALQVDDLSHVPDLSSPFGKHRILNIRRQVEEYIRQARRSILDLRTPSLASRDLPQALREAAERAIGDKQVTLDISVNGAPQSYAPSVEEQLLLIGQEAVSNAVQHGQARRVAVEIDYAHDETRLRVIDDGCGFDLESAAAANGHYGLLSMRERAEQVKGKFTIASAPGSGTKVETVVPT